MVTSTYGFPKNDLTAAIAAADDLARRHRDGTARRLHADGSIDLAAMEGWLRRRFLLYRVSPAGTAALVKTTAAPAAYGSSVAMMFIGVAVFAGSTLGAILRQEEGQSGLGLAIIGFIVAVVGISRGNRFDLSWYLRETFGTDSGWKQVFAPTEWAPRSVAQLRAVERLADDHGGKALARPHPDGGTEVRTLDGGRLHKHLVTPDGTVLLIARSKPAALYILAVALVAIGVGGAVVTTLLYNLTDVPVVTAFYVSLGLFGLAFLLGPLVRVESSVKDRANGGWHLVQTKRDDPD